MFIAFEGPDMTGKSTSASRLSVGGAAIYQATKKNYEEAQRDLSQYSGIEPDLVQAFDRIDWFSHMVYRLALPDRDWNDDRPRTVFAMPDTHLVVKVHRPDLADFTADEVVDTPIARVNPMYYYFADYFMSLNRARNYELFKSVTIVEVSNDQHNGTFSQRVAEHDSPVFDHGTMAAKIVYDDEGLLEFLRYVDSHIG